MWVIDGGAGQGQFTVPTAKAVGAEGRVVAIEPHLDNAALLTVSLRPFPHATVLTAALTAKDGLVPFYPDLNGSYTGSLASENCTKAGDRVDVAGITLDTVTAEWSRVDAVKLDLQGAELWALHGGHQTMARWHPLIVLEIWPEGLAQCDSSVDAILALLTSAGYERDPKIGKSAEKIKTYTDWLFTWPG